LYFVNVFSHLGLLDSRKQHRKGGEKMGGKMIGNYANDGTLYISATNAHVP